MICRRWRGWTTPDTDAATVDLGGMRRPAHRIYQVGDGRERHRSGGRGRSVVATLISSVWLAWLLLSAVAAAHAEPTPPAPGVAPGVAGSVAHGVTHGVKVYVDRPGVYAVDLEEVRRIMGQGSAGFPDESADDLRLTHDGRPVPCWLADGEAGSPRRLLFVADSTMFQRTDPRDARPLKVLLLTLGAEDGAGADEGPMPLGPAVEGGAPSGAQTVARRRLHLEQNVLRAPVTGGDLDVVDTLWFWATLTPQSSSQLEVDLGDLSDRSDRLDRETADGPVDLDVTVRLLGWSRSNAPDGMAQHHVDLYLDDQKIGESVFDGRRTVSLHAADVPASLLRDRSNVLRVKVPARPVPARPGEASPDPLLDFVYVDWIDVSYRVRSPLADGDAPLHLDGSSSARWLADPEGSPVARLFAVTNGGASEWTVPRRSDGGWLLPPSDAAEVWVVDGDQIGTPIAVEPLSVGARSVPADADYLMIAPPELMAGAERLAALHRHLGRTVAVVDVNAVYDQFGGGERSPQAIRRFLDDQLARSDRLHWVLLIGDADWFTPDDRWPSLRPDPNDRNRIPSWTFLSRYEPAASDQYYAMDPEDETAPRFAIGRLPVVDPAVLDAYVDKVVAWLGSGEDPTAGPMLMLSDATKGSLLQQRRLRQRLADLPIELLGPEPASRDTRLDDAAITVFDRRHPSLVYFGGHGSRFMWELGDPTKPSPESFFDLDDVARLAPTADQPIVMSISCATAPFDHPTASSLGEGMVLSGGRGAVAYIGASAPLLTPPRFGEALVRNLLEMETVGDAFMAAKRQLGRAEVSHLYNLLGDPGLPLQATDRPEGRTQEHQGHQEPAQLGGGRHLQD